MLPVPYLIMALILCLLTGKGDADACKQAQERELQTAMLWQRLAEMRVAGVYDQPVQLSAGQFTGAPFVAGGHSRPVLRLWPELFATGDLEGQIWRLVNMGAMGRPAPFDCATFAIHAGHITGSIDGRRYTGTIVETAPGQIVMSHLTGSAAIGQEVPVAREASYLALLASVTQYTFLTGQLMLLGQHAGRLVQLTFAPTETDVP